MAPELVLFADDSPTVRFLLRSVLERDFGVIEAKDGAQAVQLALAERPSVILLDLEMPELDGHSALLQIRRIPELATTPVLIVTGAAGGDTATACLRDGAHDFVRKPFEAAELLARVKAAHRFRIYEDELRRRNRDLEHFAAVAAHDLKAPLAGIRMIAEVLAGDRIDDASRRRLQEDIGLLANHGSRMVADLLDLARQDWVGGVVPAPPVDAERAVWDAVAQARLVDADVDVDGDWARVTVAEADLASVLANLIANASHYGRDGGGRLSLSITAAPRADRLAITVTDRGAGVSPDLADQIFHPFYAAPDSHERNPDSTGLGLALVKRTVERHGGRITLDPSAVGCAFTVTLPLADS